MTWKTVLNENCLSSALYVHTKYNRWTEYMGFHYEAYVYSSYCCSAFSMHLQKTTTLNSKSPRERPVFCLIISAINQSNIYLPITELWKIHLSLLPGATFLTVINKMIRNPYFWIAFSWLFSPVRCPSQWKSALKLEQILHLFIKKTERSGNTPLHQIYPIVWALSLDSSSLWLEVAHRACVTCCSAVNQPLDILLLNKWVPARRPPLLRCEMPLCTACFCQSFTFH